jgi:predicted DCC family thiol-disulfide oxidoreductase YuxK
VKLYVLYDHGCGLCSHLVQWMSQQHSSCEVHYVAAGSTHARRLFPKLLSPARPEELVVVSGEGVVYRGDDAFIMCLYALDAYRSLAVRVSRPAFRPLARRLFSMISTNRLRLSDFLGLRSDEALTRAMVCKPTDVLDGREKPTW